MQSKLAFALPVARALDPVLASLALSAAQIEPLDQHRLPGRRSMSGRKHFWRSPDATPAPSTKRRIVVFN
jgi:hypothetical protein